MSIGRLLVIRKSWVVKVLRDHSFGPGHSGDVVYNIATHCLRHHAENANFQNFQTHVFEWICHSNIDTPKYKYVLYLIAHQWVFAESCRTPRMAASQRNWLCFCIDFELSWRYTVGMENRLVASRHCYITMYRDWIIYLLTYVCH